MSRSEYTEDCSGWDLVRWRGAVNSAIRGKLGQMLLKEMAAALDAMPVKSLIVGKLITCAGEVCALGAVAKARAMDVSDIENDDLNNIRELIANRFDIAEALAAEIMFENDEGEYWADETPEKRWIRMRKWVEENIVKMEKK